MPMGNLVILPGVHGQVFYLVSEAFRGWKQHRTVIVPSLVTIFLCSVLLCASLTFLLGALHGISHRDSFHEIETFFLDNPTPEERLALQARVMAIKAVESVRYVDPEEAKEEFRKDFSSDMLDLVKGNPLPASFRITLQPQYRNPMELAKVIRELERWDTFDSVQAPLGWAEWIERWRFDMVFWPVLVSILLLLTLGLIIGNAVRLTLFSRKLLVENMKYAGGSSFFIQFPFVLEGLMQGLLGSLSAVALWGALVWTLVDKLPVLEPYVHGISTVLAGTAVLVTLIGAYASFRSVRSFLQHTW